MFRAISLAITVALAGLTGIGVSTAAGINNWTGYYVGGNVGDSWGSSNTDVSLHSSQVVTQDVSLGSSSASPRGIFGGLQAGYNWRANSWVFGLAGDVNITGQRGSSEQSGTAQLQLACLAPCTPPPPVPVTGTFDYTQQLPWFGTLRGRVGFIPTQGWLAYATGGLAYGEIKSDGIFSVPSAACIAPCVPPPTSASGSFTHNKAGWVLGAGIETALGGNWSAGLEYLHIDFGNTSDTFASRMAPPFLGSFTARSRVTDDILRIALNYRFGG